MTTTTTRAETILKLADFEVLYHASVDLEHDYSYQVFDQDEDLVFETDDRDEAIGQAREGQAELDEERKAERIDGLQADVIDLVYELDDEATLRKVLALLKRAK